MIKHIFPKANTNPSKETTMLNPFRSATFYLALAVAALALAIFFTPSAALDNLGDGLLQIIPASIIGVLLLFGFMALWKRLRLMSDKKRPDIEGANAFDRVIEDPIATAILMAGVVLGIALIIAAGFS